MTDAMAPVPYRVRSGVVENADSVTLVLEPLEVHVAESTARRVHDDARLQGVGEVAISTSGISPDGNLTHTIRTVGAVSAALCATEPGSTIGMRGPFGTSWGLAEAAGRDLVIVAGGVGLAPLHPVLLGALAQALGGTGAWCSSPGAFPAGLPLRRGTG